MNINDKDQLYWYGRIALLLVASVLIFIGLGFRDPWPADEPRFAQIAKEMVETGQWFFPTRGAEYYPDKPPIFMWAIAFFLYLTGSIKVAFLLPSALASLLTIYLVYDLGKRFWGRSEALIAGGLLLFSLQFLLQAKTAQIDAMVTCWITLGCYGLLRFLLLERRWRWYYMAFFFMGIGVITKGVGFLPVLLLLPYYFYQKKCAIDNSMTAKPYDFWRWLAGPLIMFVAIALWLLPMLVQVELSQDPALFQYRDNILFRQTVTRYADSWHHIKPFWYYIIEVIPLFWLPISLALPWLVPKWYRAIKSGEGRILLPAVWVVLVLLFFSISPGKRGVYILPALPMLCLISAPYIQQLILHTKLARLVWAVVVLLSAIFIATGLGGLAEVPFLVKFETKFGISPWSFFFVIGLLGMASSAFSARKSCWKAWPLFIALLMVGYSTWGYILLDDVKTPKNVFRNIQKVVQEQDVTIALVNFSEQFILFSPYSVIHFGYHTDTQAQLDAAYLWLADGNKKRYVLVDAKDASSGCFDLSKAQPVGYAHRANWLLISSDAKKANCAIAPLHTELKPYYYPLNTHNSE